MSTLYPIKLPSPVMMPAVTAIFGERGISETVTIADAVYTSVVSANVRAKVFTRRMETDLINRSGMVIIG